MFGFIVCLPSKLDRRRTENTMLIKTAFFPPPPHSWTALSSLYCSDTLWNTHTMYTKKGRPRLKSLKKKKKKVQCPKPASRDVFSISTLASSCIFTFWRCTRVIHSLIIGTLGSYVTAAPFQCANLPLKSNFFFPPNSSSFEPLYPWGHD